MAKHIFDNDACCIACGFDGAEHHWLNHNTYEGVANPQPEPSCDAPEHVRAKALAMQPPAYSIYDDDDWEQDYGNDDDKSDNDRAYDDAYDERFLSDDEAMARVIQRGATREYLDAYLDGRHTFNRDGWEGRE